MQPFQSVLRCWMSSFCFYFFMLSCDWFFLLNSLWLDFLLWMKGSDLQSERFHRPVSVSGRAAPAPSPCWTAAAPGLYFGTDIDRSPAAVFKKKFNGNNKTLTKYKKFRKIIVQFLPAEVFCLFHFLSAAPFLHTGAGSHRHVLLFS